MIKTLQECLLRASPVGAAGLVGQQLTVLAEVSHLVGPGNMNSQHLTDTALTSKRSHTNTRGGSFPPIGPLELQDAHCAGGRKGSKPVYEAHRIKCGSVLEKLQERHQGVRCHRVLMRPAPCGHTLTNHR